MTLSLRTADPRSDPALGPLLDAAFQRPDRESRLVRRLAEGFPGFDPGLSLVAEEAGRPLGYALFLPRAFRLRGADVRLAISSPFCTLPDARRRGAGRFLLEAGLAALADRGVRGAIVLGGQDFFSAHGYRGAFNLYTLDARRDLLPDEDTSAWGGLTGDDLGHLGAIYGRNYAGISGSERRSDLPIDWESAAREAYTMVLRRDGRAVAYLRFRVRETLAVMECGAADPAAASNVAAMLRRLALEHGRPSVEVHVPPTHPVARDLFQRGCMIEANDFHDAATLRITDWPGFLADTDESWLRGLAACGRARLSLGIDGQDLTLEAAEGGLRVLEGRCEEHVELPAGWAEPLVTGRRDWRDLAFHEAQPGALEARLGRDGLRALFPSGTPVWTYSPIFEIADE